MFTGLATRTAIEMKKSCLIVFGWILVTAGCNCGNDVEKEFEKCELYIDHDGDGYEGCEDSDCETDPSCMFAYSYIEESIYTWIKLPNDMNVSERDIIKGGSVLDVFQGEERIYILATCIPRYSEQGIAYCGNTDQPEINDYGYTRMWEISIDDINFGRIDLNWEDSVELASGGWGQEIETAYDPSAFPYASMIIDDFDGDGKVDYIVAQPSESMGATVNMWYGNESENFPSGEADTYSSGSSFGRLGYLGNLNESNNRSYGVVVGEYDNKKLQIAKGGQRLNGNELDSMLSENEVTLQMDNAEVAEVFIGGEHSENPSNGDGRISIMAIFKKYEHDEHGILSVGDEGTFIASLGERENWTDIEPLGQESNWSTAMNYYQYGIQSGPVDYPFTMADYNCDGVQDYVLGKPNIRQEDTPVDPSITEIPRGGVLVIDGNNENWSGKLVPNDGGLV